MSKLSILIVDTEEDYVSPLEMKFSEELGENAEISVITDKEYLKEHFRSLRKIDILIINEELYNPQFENHNISNIFILLESKRTNTTEDISLYSIYKYTSVKEIYNEVMNNLKKQAVEAITNELKTKIIMIYSPSGGIGKTTVALGASAALAKYHKKVLYINTESIQSFQGFLDDCGYLTSGIERQMIAKKEDLLDYLPSSIGKGPFEYFLPLKQTPSSLNLVLDDYLFLINKIKESKKYDFIVVDSSTELNREKAKLMSASDKVIIVTAQDKISVGKLECLLNNIDCSDNGKFIFICNKYYSGNSNYLIGDGIINKCTVNEYIDYMELNRNDFNIETLGNNNGFQKLAYMFI